MKTLYLTAVVAVSIATSASSAPVQWSVANGGNDHWYEFVDVSLNWSGARAAALASIHQGQNGYLVTITAAAEDLFLTSTFGFVDGWIGASDQAVEGEWRWMDGPEAGQLFWTGGVNGTASGYSNWHPTNPSDSGGEDHGHLLAGTGLWNDATAPRGYFVEFAKAPVPEPASWAMMIAGLGLAGAAVRRRRLHVAFA